MSLTKDKYIILDNVVIPIRVDEHFIPPDLEKGLEYYSSYIRHSSNNITEIEYLQKLIKTVSQCSLNEYRNDPAKIMKGWLRYIGVKNV